MSVNSPPNHRTDISPVRYSKAAHLSEFYPYLNGNSQQQQEQQKEESVDPLFSNKQQAYPRQTIFHSRKPSSSTLNSYSTFAPSAFDFSNLISKSEIADTTEAFNKIIETADEYQKALSAVSEAAANLGSALENGAKSKGVGPAGEGLLNASGLFFLVANHEQILSHSIKKNFEDPIISKINQFKLQNIKNENQFKIDIKDKIKDLKKQEYENLKISKLKTRNLVTYRSKLLELTSQIDDIDKLKQTYYQDSFSLVQETSNAILTQLGTIIRAQVEIYEGIAKKGWSGGGLDDLISQCPDPFAYDEDELKTNEDEYHNDNIDNDNNNNNSLIETTSNGLSIKRDSLANLTAISQPVTTIQSHNDPVLSTPISKSTLIDVLEAQNERSQSIDGSSKQSSRQSTKITSPEQKPQQETEQEPEEIEPVEEEEISQINEELANATFEDDNSFSLPMPGSSRSTKSPAKPDEERTVDTSNILESEDHHVWRDHNH